MSSQYAFYAYNAVLNYSLYDVLYNGGQYWYSTKDSNVGHDPNETFVFAATSYSRTDDIATIVFAVTGNIVPFAAGSIVQITGFANDTLNYSGMILSASSGSISYINPGWSQGSTVVSIGAINAPMSPNWTTGFYFQPTYTTKIGTQNQTIVAQFSDGYSQRQPQGINTFAQNIGLVYQNRDKRQARAMTNFVEDKAGATAFPILLPDPFLNNQPNQQWIAPTIEVTPVSFGLYDIAVSVTRVFDP